MQAPARPKFPGHYLRMPAARGSRFRVSQVGADNLTLQARQADKSSELRLSSAKSPIMHFVSTETFSQTSCNPLQARVGLGAEGEIIITATH
jgi:hypothetical protein